MRGMDKDKHKREISAPCGQSGKYPDVACNYNCAECGWNPAQRFLRLHSGVWKDHDTYVTAKGNVIFRDIKTLHF